MKSLEELFEEVYCTEWIKDIVDTEIEFARSLGMDDKWYEAVDRVAEEFEHTFENEPDTIKEGIKEDVLLLWDNEWDQYPDECRAALMEELIYFIVAAAVRIAINDEYGHVFFDIDGLWMDFDEDFVLEECMEVEENE